MKLCFAFLAFVLVGCGGGGGSSSTPTNPGPVDELRVSSGFNCFRLSNGLTFYYSGVTFNSGDAWVKCEVGDTSLQSSSSSFYRPTQPGATSFFCSLIFDIDTTASAGYWEFTYSPSRAVVYKDSGSAFDQTTIAFTVGSCTTF